MKRVLVVDDDLSTLSQLSVQLGGHHDVLLAKSGEQALAICQQDPPDLVLLDVTMPGMDGFDTIAALKQELLLERLPVIFATATRDAAVEVRALQSGAVDFILKPLQKDILLHRIALHSRLFGYQRQMEQTVQNLEDAVISSFSSMMEYRGEDVSGHIARIVRYTVVLGEALRSMGTFSSELSAHTLGLIVRAVPLHDVGKIGVSDVIWSKPGMLSDEEFAVMKSHTT
ncbi:MAG: response regulator, partial [Burkholderiaceae bacterium]|nr:response regulator [Burkholderiaceae bacterium]